MSNIHSIMITLYIVYEMYYFITRDNATVSVTVDESRQKRAWKQFQKSISNKDFNNQDLLTHYRLFL